MNTGFPIFYVYILSVPTLSHTLTTYAYVVVKYVIFVDYIWNVDHTLSEIINRVDNYVALTDQISHLFNFSID